MKSPVSLLALLLAGAALAVAQEPPPGDGPRGSSELAAGEVRYDVVGRAVIGDLVGVSATSSGLPAGSYAEITALDTGRTIVVAILGGTVAPGQVATLSQGAAAAIGMSGDGFAVRVRKVVPTPQDIVQLRGGQAASFRAEAPQALLVALRKKLAPAAMPAGNPRPAPVARAPRAIPAPVARPVESTASVKPVTTGYIVQVAALSSAARAAVVARAVGGTIVAGPPVWRVRLGPYPDAAAAGRAKADSARKGYPGGQITRIP
jgi:rare lipoprotein A